MDTTRQHKFNKQLQKDLSEIINKHTKDFAAGKMLTVTRVRITTDLSLARTYISVFPSKDSDQVINKLNIHMSQFRHELAQKVRHQMRKVPELRFYLDDSLDYIDNIDNLLKE